MIWLFLASDTPGVIFGIRAPIPLTRRKIDLDDTVPAASVIWRRFISPLKSRRMTDLIVLWRTLVPRWPYIESIKWTGISKWTASVAIWGTRSSSAVLEIFFIHQRTNLLSLSPGETTYERTTAYRISFTGMRAVTLH